MNRKCEGQTSMSTTENPHLSLTNILAQDIFNTGTEDITLVIKTAKLLLNHPI